MRGDTLLHSLKSSFYLITCRGWNRNSSVGTPTGLRYRRSGVRIPLGHLPLLPDVQSGPPSLLLGTGSSYPGRIKRPDHEYDHAHPPSAKMNKWKYTSTPPYAFIVCTEPDLAVLSYPNILYNFCHFFSVR